MALREIREGLARLLVPDVPRSPGPGKNTGIPFYNPTMAKNRDLTVLFLKALKRARIRMLDGLAATGAMGIRAAMEVPGLAVSCNDSSPEAVELIRQNAELNNVTLESLHNDRLQAHLSENGYDVVDIDPFGTPAPYLDSAFQSSPRDGIVACTATDTAVLCGAQPRTCIRRYEARPLHIDCQKEIGLRILIGHCARVAARYDRSVEPLLSVSSDHFMRVIVKVEHGAQRADESLSNLGYVVFDKETGERIMAGRRPTEGEWAGPLWAGRLTDGGILSRLSSPIYMGHETSMLVESLKAEVDAPALFVTSGFLARHTRTSPPRMVDFIKALRTGGYTAIRTHFHLEGVKTNAPWSELIRVYRGLAR